MSGDVALVDPGDGAVSRLVRTAATLFDSPEFRPTALVGGLAVTIRLATVHRATNDVDTVSEGDGPRDLALQYLGDADAATENRIEIDGVKVDVMATWPLPASSDELPEDDLDRLFVLGHRWALDTAASLVVDVVSTDATSVVDSGMLTVATAPALVACKLHAIADRRGAALTKQESDALDLVRLVGELVRGPEVIEAFRAAPFDLDELVADQIERWFITDALRTARLAGTGTGAPGSIDAADISMTGRLLLDQLRS